MSHIDVLVSGIGEYWKKFRVPKQSTVEESTATSEVTLMDSIGKDLRSCSTLTPVGVSMDPVVNNLSKHKANRSHVWLFDVDEDFESSLGMRSRMTKFEESITKQQREMAERMDVVQKKNDDVKKDFEIQLNYIQQQIQQVMIRIDDQHKAN